MYLLLARCKPGLDAPFSARMQAHRTRSLLLMLTAGPYPGQIRG
jgi:hypothetical protein